MAYCAFTQPATPSTNTVVRVDTSVQVTTVVSPSCAFLLLTPADYQRLNTYTTTTPGPDVNVTSDMFFGAVLVVLFAVGWIAGAQR